MTALLDTSILIEISKGNEKVIKGLENTDKNSPPPFVSTVTYSEYYYGFLNSVPLEMKKCLDFLDRFQQVTLTKSSARRLAELKYKYKKTGINFTTMDLLNAAIAIEENMIFITSDKFFEKIDELKKIIINR